MKPDVNLTQSQPAYFAARLREFADQVEMGAVDILEISVENPTENKPTWRIWTRAKPTGRKRLSFLYTNASPTSAKAASHSSRALQP